MFSFKVCKVSSFVVQGKLTVIISAQLHTWYKFLHKIKSQINSHSHKGSFSIHHHSIHISQKTGMQVGWVFFLPGGVKREWAYYNSRIFCCTDPCVFSPFNIPRIHYLGAWGIYYLTSVFPYRKILFRRENFMSFWLEFVRFYTVQSVHSVHYSTQMSPTSPEEDRAHILSKNMDVWDKDKNSLFILLFVGINVETLKKCLAFHSDAPQLASPG